MKKSLLSIFILFAIFFAIPNIYAESHINELNENNIYTISVFGEYDYDNAKEVLRLVNIEREKEGLSALALDKELTELAMQRAKEISIYQGHTRPNGESWSTISPRGDEENIAFLYYTPKKAMEGWMGSPSHRAAILNSERKSMGVGCYTTYEKTYWVQIFSSEEVKESFTGKGTYEVQETVEIKSENLNFNVFYNGGKDSIIVTKNNNLPVYRIQHINPNNTASETNLSPTDFIWKSSNPEIFTVSADGTITGVSIGQATLSVSIGDIVKEYPVQVTIDLEEISFPKEVRVRKGFKQTLEPTFLPLGSSIPLDSIVKWTSSNTKVATVNSSGVVTAKEEGTTTITLTIGTITASTEVVVYDKKVGDLDENGVVNIKDIFNVMTLAVNRINYSIESIKLADVNKNGRIDFVDIYCIVYFMIK